MRFRPLLLLGSIGCFILAAQMLYSWFDAEYIGPEKHYALERDAFERGRDGNWNDEFMSFPEWCDREEQRWNDFKELTGVECADAFDIFGWENVRERYYAQRYGHGELNSNSEGTGSNCRDNAMGGPE